MAEAVIGAVVDVALSKAISIVEEQINLAWNFKHQLNKLRASLTMARAFLQDVGTRQVDGPLRVWLELLRDVTAEADDVLDELAYEHLRRKVKETQKRKKVRNFFSPYKNHLTFSFKMAKKVNKIKLSMDEINRQASVFGLQQRVQNMAPLVISGEPGTHSFVDSSRVVGRKADVLKIVDLLTTSTNQQTNFNIVSIVGMGGLGKTTLAKLACNTERIKNYFNKIMWVCVAENFDVQRILQEKLESLTRQTCDIKNRNAILENLKTELEGNTYLLVLDDVWDEDIEKWEDLSCSLLGINESKLCSKSLLVTSRCDKVALVRETPLDNRHYLKALMADDCWSIIKERAFASSLMSPELEAIGREIAQKCAGVPLVARVIGGTMCNKRDVEEWMSIKNNPLWSSLERNDAIVRVLKLSFHRLPSTYLKQCFVYCSIFPKDILMEKQQLIQLWMAEGLLQQPKGIPEQAAEDIGNEYFNHLLSNSFFQDMEQDTYGRIVRCKMHDLVHDLAQSISKENLLSSGTNSAWCNTSDSQYLDVDVNLWHSLFLKKINSLFIVHYFKGLRVLKFFIVLVQSLPDEIGSIKHLRYLDVSKTPIRWLPKSISQLYLLQTLRLLGCEELLQLPDGMKNLVSLRHLYISHARHVPNDIGCLTSLRTLPVFEVGGNGRRRIGELACLIELQGDLAIFDLQNVGSKEEAREAKLWEKKNLQKLVYVWHSWELRDYCKDEEVLEGLEPHSNLKSLTIKGYKGGLYPSWLARESIVSNSNACFQPINLVELQLIRCKNVKNLLPLILFSRLEKLSLEDMEEVQEWLEAESTIPTPISLKELEIKGCYKLRSVPNMSRYPSLEKLHIEWCNQLSWREDGVFVIPSSLQELHIEGCDKLSRIEGPLSSPSSSICLSLRDVCIRYCPNLTSICFQGISSFSSSSLFKLQLKDCHKLREIEGGISTLQELHIERCGELYKIGDQGLLSSSTCLRDVTIHECLNLTSISFKGGSSSSSFFQLELKDCGGLREIEGGPGLQKLEKLDIRDCDNLISLPIMEEGLSSLSKLGVDSCGGLTSLPSGLRNCTSLEILHVHDCCNLNSIPEESLGCLTRLKRLTLGRLREEVEEFPGLSSIHLLHSSLQQLTLHGWQQLSSLSYQIQHLTSLEELRIWEFDGVTALPEWLGNLSSLRSLDIWRCKNLRSLPSREAMQRLSNLQRVEIIGCPALMENQDELSKISHIPHNRIG